MRAYPHFAESALIAGPLTVGKRFAGLAAVCLLGGCAMLGNIPGGQSSTPDEPAPPESAEATVPQMPFGTDVSEPMLPDVALRFHILTAELAMQRGEPAAAAEHYLAAARLDDDVRLVQSATRAALAAENFDLALRAADRWAELDEESRQPQQLALRLHLAAGDMAKVNGLAQKLVENHPEGQDAGLREVAIILSSEQQHAETALAVMKRLVAKAPTEPAARYALGMMALRVEQFELAEAQADWALRLKPGWEEAALIKAQAQLNQGNAAGAESVMKELLQSDPRNLEVILAFARLFLDGEAYPAATRAYTRALAVDGKNQEALFAMGLLSLEAEQLDTGYKYLSRLYDVTGKKNDEESRLRHAEAAFYLGRVEEQRKHWDKAETWYNKVEEGQRVFESQVRLAWVIYKRGDLSAARAKLAQLRNRYRAQALELYLTEAEILYDARDYQEAMAHYDLALEQFPEEPDLLYGRALILTELNKVDQAIADLRELIEVTPDDARSLNALGYILTNHSDQYDEALKYISKALELTPEDAAVIDSMGWVQYRMGNLNSALKFLNDAWSRHQDPEIAAHLGEVLWKLGQRERAEKVWSEALDDDPDHPVLNETVKRLKP